MFSPRILGNHKNILRTLKYYWLQFYANDQCFNARLYDDLFFQILDINHVNVTILDIFTRFKIFLA